ncbi:GspL/Epsl periplasmic domain-containing protein [Pseudomonas mosselii]|uniref:GspL/Epsl periplasmic domain-containing protein n=1 Tax=Pseudomonas mosselii TaxID=78327 RepID=UPI000D895BE4|nr:GspL/Epsl periplasmic domain-containing protein [Pseudomonas mosselii]PYC19473.1 type II secretion system protein GspL [Pseudomonas mosselii]
MNLDWRRRVPAQPWLLLRPGEVWEWLLVIQGSPVRQGQGEPPSGLEARVALIVPGEHCSHFQLAAPPGLKREEWPLLVEDRLLQGADEVLCTCIGRHAGHLQLLVVARARLSEWRAQCDAWALPVERCWAEFQLLPDSVGAAGWHWRRGAMSLYKGLAHWLAWPQVFGQPPVLGWPAEGAECIEGPWPEVLAPLDGLPGVFEARRTRSRPRLQRGHSRLAVACLALALTWGGLWCALQWRQTQVYRAQVLVVTGAQATPRQAALALKRLQDDARESQVRLRLLDALQTQVHAWLNDHPGWQVRAVRFDGQRWLLELEGEGAVAPWQDMATAIGVPVQVEDEARRVVFDLGSAA